jgi:hypothetical protein
MASQDPRQPSSSHWHPNRPPYPTLSTPTSSATSYPAAPTSNPASTSSLSSDISTGSGNNEIDSQRMTGLGGVQPHWNESPYQPPMPSPTIAQNPHFGHFQPLVGELAGNDVQQQEQLAKISAHLRSLQQQRLPPEVPPNPHLAGLVAQQNGYVGDYFPPGNDMNAMQRRREAANQLVQENSLVSEAATRLIIKEMDNIGF